MPPDEVLSVTEAMKYCKVSRQTLIRLIKAGRIPANKFGRNYRMFRGDLEKFIRGETGPAKGYDHIDEGKAKRGNKPQKNKKMNCT